MCRKRCSLGLFSVLRAVWLAVVAACIPQLLVVERALGNRQSSTCCLAFPLSLLLSPCVSCFRCCIIGYWSAYASTGHVIVRLCLLLSPAPFYSCRKCTAVPLSAQVTTCDPCAFTASRSPTLPIHMYVDNQGRTSAVQVDQSPRTEASRVVRRLESYGPEPSGEHPPSEKLRCVALCCACDWKAGGTFIPNDVRRG